MSSKLTIRAIIKGMGGTMAAADKLAIDHSSISGWIRRGKIPPARLFAVHEATEIPIAQLAKLTGTSSDQRGAA